MRCKMQVRSIIEGSGCVCTSIDSGEFVLLHELTESNLSTLTIRLNEEGFFMLSDYETHVFKTIKGIIAELVHYSDQVIKVDLDDYLYKKMEINASELLLLFSSVKGISIEQYFKLQKIERAKELILYDGLSIDLIVQKLSFGSISEMQHDFRKLSGLNPDFFENLRIQRLKSIELCE